MPIGLRGPVDVVMSTFSPDLSVPGSILNVTPSPLCLTCTGPEHSLYIQPDLGGPDPVWVCELSGDVVAPLGGLGD